MLSYLLTAFYQLALFFFYFFYFLFKGKPEWQKTGSDERCTTNNCCLHNPKVQSEISSSGSPTPAKNAQAVDEQSDSVKAEVSWRSAKQTATTTITSTFQKFQRRNSCRQLCEQYANKAAQTFQWLCNTIYCILVRFVTLVPNIIVWLSTIIYEWLFGRRSATSFGAPIRFVQKTIAETTAEEAQAKLYEQNQQQQFSSTDAFTESAASYSGAEVLFQKRSPVEESVIKSGEFYSRKQSYPRDFEGSIPDDSSAIASAAGASSSSSPPPPPPPLVPTFTTIKSSMTSKDVETTAEKVPPKGGVAVLPPDIMAEAHARVKEREQKLSEQKADEPQESNENLNTDWTVTSKRFIPSEWTTTTSKVENLAETESKASEEESETWKPTGKNVVSRIPRSSDQDAQFIFHTPKHHTVPSNWLPEGSFLMGRSVFSPVREAEEMRNRVNRRLTETPSESRFGSRLDTPLEDSFTTSRVNTPLDSATYNSHLDRYSSYPASRSRSQSRVHTVLSPVTVKQAHSPRTEEHRINMLRQRSRTVEPRAESTVKALTRQWPPRSNATGVQVAKDNWNIIPSEIVSCRTHVLEIVDGANVHRTQAHFAFPREARNTGHQVIPTDLIQLLARPSVAWITFAGRCVVAAEYASMAISNTGQLCHETIQLLVLLYRDGFCVRILITDITDVKGVMERSVTDKWTTRDEKGDIVDEWSTRSWKGESDGLRRRDDGTGEAWHREVDVSPHGQTSFIDNRRLYTRDYVIESEARNA